MSNNTHTEVLVAGACAAFTIDLLVYPLDTLKTRWQSQDYIDTFKRSPAAKNVPKQTFRGLYQGVGSVIVATVPAAGVFFTTYESVKSALSRALPEGVPKPLVHSLASGTAELASCLILTPAEVIKQNAQMIRSSGGSGGGGGGGGTSLQALRMLRASDGGASRRLWTGYTALAARNLPFTAMQFPMFEHIRASLWRWRDGRRRRREQLAFPSHQREAGGVDPGQGLLETGLVNGTSAALSGSVAAVLTTPTDVVKTRMMLLGGKSRTSAESGDASGKVRRRAGGLQVAKDIYAELGVRGLFRGGLFRAGWTALGSGLYLGTYEVAKVWLKGGEGPESDGVI
ncbi:hypothetical protein MAPG_02827 [Magnaporthiopsis poae ATCC 64411]|uniref:Uncharacterized protein n=1 Tax=Magnaporthiopsis poae (strain ATCC 64411 / 73-15) TaxID=644358 RepID=A0A0C4DSE8_MAGP6|nr:hypothetical protein MAPG_02827 [Magnaporthiopsis poae ATCC 64411]